MLTSSLQREENSYERQQKKEAATLALLNLNFIYDNMTASIRYFYGKVVIEPDCCGANVLAIHH